MKKLLKVFLLAGLIIENIALTQIKIDTITDEAIMGRYKLVTEHIYPDDFIQMREMILKPDENLVIASSRSLLT